MNQDEVTFARSFLVEGCIVYIRHCLGKIVLVVFIAAKSDGA
jgi:hypothetical protein